MSEVQENYSYNNTFSTTITSTPSASTQVLTVQTPSASKTARFIDAHIYCAGAVTITLERYAGQATTTSNPISAFNPNDPNVVTTAFAAFASSNVTAGTVLDTFTLAAGGDKVIDLSDYTITGITDSLTLRSSSISSSITLTLRWREF